MKKQKNIFYVVEYKLKDNLFTGIEQIPSFQEPLTIDNLNKRIEKPWDREYTNIKAIAVISRKEGKTKVFPFQSSRIDKSTKESITHLFSNCIFSEQKQV